MGSAFDQLRRFALFERVDDAPLQRLAALMSLHRYTEGVLLFYEEQSMPHLHLLLEGQVRVYKVDRLGNEIFLYMLEGGDVLTEFGNLRQPACEANLLVSAPSAVGTVPMDRFMGLLREEGELMEAMLHAFVQKSARLQCTLSRETVFDTTAKVAHFLFHQLPQFNRLKRQEVAARLNIQPETLSRILRKLLRDEIVAAQEGALLSVLDAGRLESLFR